MPKKAKKDKKDKKDKKKSKDKKDKKKTKKDKEDASDSSASSSAANLPGGASGAAGASGEQTPAFSAGQLFERYSRNGVIGISEFQKLVESEQMKPLPPSRVQVPGKREEDFEVGRLFERFSHSVPGHVTLEEFGNLVRTLRGNGGISSGVMGGFENKLSYGNASPPPAPNSYAATMQSAASASDSVVKSSAPQLPRALVDLRARNIQNIGGGNGASKGTAPGGSLGSIEERDAESASNSNSMLSALPLASTELHILSMNMMSKRDHLVQQMRYVQARTEEVQSVRRAIERETVADTEAILHRLRSQEQFKLSLLNHDMAQLQHDIDEIDAFNQELRGGKNPATGQLSGGGNASGGFGTASSVITGAATARGRYLETCAEAERIIGKPFKTECTVQADDFDRETADRIARSNEYSKMEEASATKDRMNYKLLQEQKKNQQRQEELKQKIDDFSRESREEMEEWVKLCTSLKEQLAKERAKNVTLRGDADVYADDRVDREETSTIDDPPVVIGTRRPRDSIG